VTGLGDDELTVDSSSTLTTVPVNFDGGGGFDRLILRQTNGPVIISDTLSPGATNGSGRSVIESNDVPDTGGDAIQLAALTQQVDFENIEPVIDTVPSPTFDFISIPGLASVLDASNAINYTQSTVLLGGGRITVDAFEPIDFTNKTVVTLDAGA